MMIVLVTGSGGPAGLNALRFLPEYIKRVACDSDPDAAQRMKQKGLEGIPFYTVPKANDPGFRDAILSIIEKESVEFIIPTVDEELVVFSQNPENFGAKIIISPKETISACNDKMLLYETFRDAVFCPRFVVTDKRSDIESTFKNSSVFMKPRIGRGSRGVCLFNTPEEIPDNVITKDNIFCEYLPGREYTIDALCSPEHELIVAIPRIRMNTDRGISVHGKTEKNQAILECVYDVCNTLKFIGPINIQFKYDSEGLPKLVEINPRISGGYPITVASGVNTLEILFDMLQGNPIPKEKLEWEEKESRQERI